MPCMCGDPMCSSCGPAQGYSQRRSVKAPRHCPRCGSRMRLLRDIWLELDGAEEKAKQEANQVKVDQEARTGRPFTDSLHPYVNGVLGAILQHALRDLACHARTCKKADQP